MIAHAGPVPVEELAPLVAAGGWMLGTAARAYCARLFRRRRSGSDQGETATPREFAPMNLGEPFS